MARGKGGLGRGLESLFEDASPIFESDAKVETLPLREIEPDPGQPRKTFDQQALGELAASIAEHGLLQPIAVRLLPSFWAACSWVRPQRVISSRMPAASSTGSRSSRCRFSTNASSMACSSETSFTTTGTSFRPAMRQARHRRSPATML